MEWNVIVVSPDSATVVVCAPRNRKPLYLHHRRVKDWSRDYATAGNGKDKMLDSLKKDTWD